MSHFSSEGVSDVECGPVAGIGQVAKSKLKGEHRDRWDTGTRPVSRGFKDLTSPEEFSEGDRSVSENEMGFTALGELFRARGNVTREASQGFQELLSPDETASSGPDDEPFGPRPSTALDATIPRTHQDDYSTGLSDVASLPDDTKYARVEEEEQWNEVDQSSYSMEQSLVGELGQHLPVAVGEYNPPPSVGEYSQPPSVGEYAQPPSVGGYSQPPSVGEYHQPPSVGEYHHPPSVGEYHQPPSVGEYHQPPSVGEYHQPPSVEASSRSSHIGESYKLSIRQVHSATIASLCTYTYVV